MIVNIKEEDYTQFLKIIASNLPRADVDELLALLGQDSTETRDIVKWFSKRSKPHRLARRATQRLFDAIKNREAGYRKKWIGLSLSMLSWKQREQAEKQMEKKEKQNEEN